MKLGELLEPLDDDDMKLFLKEAVLSGALVMGPGGVDRNIDEIHELADITLKWPGQCMVDYWIRSPKGEIVWEERARRELA